MFSGEEFFTGESHDKIRCTSFNFNNNFVIDHTCNKMNNDRNMPIMREISFIDQKRKDEVNFIDEEYKELVFALK